MTKVAIVLLCAALLLSGCINTGSIPRESEAPTANRSVEPTEPPQINPEQQVLNTIEDWLSEDFSFSISYRYMNLAYNGISQDTVQTVAKDGSFSFTTERRQWDHTADYEHNEKSEFFYCYENDSFVCYMRTNDSDVNKTVLSAEELADMDSSKAMLVGMDGLFPSYLKSFRKTEENKDFIIYTFQLPVQNVLRSDTMLSVYIQSAFYLFGSKYDPAANLEITCNVELEKETLRPVKLSYDFSELKPYVLSEGALSGEYALDAELMNMIYTFDYSLANTVPTPDFVTQYRRKIYQ